MTRWHRLQKKALPNVWDTHTHTNDPPVSIGSLNYSSELRKEKGICCIQNVKISCLISASSPTPTHTFLYKSTKAQLVEIFIMKCLYTP